MKQLIKNYTINTSSKTITLTDFSTNPIVLERLLLITDITTSTVLYQFNSTVGVTAAANVLTFTTFVGVTNTDKLQIYYDTQSGDPTYDTPPLPSGAATAANQSTGNTSTATVAANTANIPSKGAAVTANSSPVNIASDQTVPVSASALPLPTGAATSANQATSNASLSTLAANLPAQGAATTAHSTPVNIASDQTVPISGTVMANAGTNTSTASLAVETGGNLATVATNTNKIPSKGTATTANSTPVNIASDQTVPVTGTLTANAGTNLNTSALALETGGNLATVAANTGNIPGKGQATMTNSTPVVIAANQSAVPVSGTFYQATQPVSGSVTTSAGTNTSTASLALEAGGNLATIATNTGAAATVANQTNGLQQTKVTNGTNVADVAAGDSGQNPAISAGARSEQTFSISAVTTTTAKDVSNYRWVSVQVSTQGSSSTVNFQGSNDGSNYQPVTLHTSGLASTGGGTGNEYANTTSTGIWYGPSNYRYFRLSITGITAGTTTGTIEYFASPSQLILPTVVAVQNGTWTFQPGNTPNTTPWLMTQSPATSGGVSIYSGSIGATATSVKSGAGQLYGWQIGNSNTSAAYVQIFNTASGSVTLGTTTPVLSLYIPASGAVTLDQDSGIAFSSAITVACTTTRTGATGPSNTVDLNLFYK